MLNDVENNKFFLYVLCIRLDVGAFQTYLVCYFMDTISDIQINQTFPHGGV